jgi:hypothetical protein
MPKNDWYIYAVFPNEKFARYWNGTGWSEGRNHAKVFRTEAEAEGPLRRMMLDNIKALVGRFSEL